MFLEIKTTVVIVQTKCNIWFDTITSINTTNCQNDSICHVCLRDSLLTRNTFKPSTITLNIYIFVFYSQILSRFRHYNTSTSPLHKPSVGQVLGRSFSFNFSQGFFFVSNFQNFQKFWVSYLLKIPTNSSAEGRQAEITRYMCLFIQIIYENK